MVEPFPGVVVERRARRGVGALPTRATEAPDVRPRGLRELASSPLTSSPLVSPPLASPPCELERERAGRDGWRWLGRGLCVLGALEVPWICLLAATLPAAAFPLAWIGLDVGEACGLLATGALVLRRDARAALPAAVSATLLVLDAWFDITTATTGADRIAALLMACGAELPIAAMCVVVASRVRRAFASGRSS